MIILTLKFLVISVTIIFGASLWYLGKKQYRIHGWLNKLFFVLTMMTVLGFETILRLGFDLTENFSDEAQAALRIHLYFSIPAVVILPLMILSGMRHYRTLHVSLGILFALVWLGTFISGVFYLPHE